MLRFKNKYQWLCTVVLYYNLFLLHVVSGCRVYVVIYPIYYIPIDIIKQSVWMIIIIYSLSHEDLLHQ